MQERVVSHIVDSVIVIWVSLYFTFFVLAIISLIFYNKFNVTVYLESFGNSLFQKMVATSVAPESRDKNKAEVPA